MPHMSTFGFGPEMIDFRTVLAAASLLGFALVLSWRRKFGQGGDVRVTPRRSLPLVGSPNVADDAMTLMLPSHSPGRHLSKSRRKPRQDRRTSRNRNGYRTVGISRQLRRTT
jgi:hypothetical protein